MYDVSYSDHVIDLLREMLTRNPARAAQLLAAVRDIDHRLRIYPQFGQPLRDLSIPRATLWIGAVSPLVVHYVLVEADDAEQGRQVMVVHPFTPFTHSGIT